MRKNKFKLVLLITILTITLTGCVSGDPIDIDPTGVWGRIVYIFAAIIVKMSDWFGDNLGWGLVITTAIFRLIQIPIYRRQIKSQKEQALIKPEMNKITQKYANKKDADSVRKKNEEIQALYSRHGINPLAGCLPLLIQMPLIFAFYGAIRGLLLSTTAEIPYQGLINLGGESLTQEWLFWDLTQISYFWAIVAALSTFLTSYLSTHIIGAAKDSDGGNDMSNTMMKSMLYVMPAMIFFMGIRFISALSIYWSVTNVLSLAQTILLRRDEIKQAIEKRKLGIK